MQVDRHQAASGPADERVGGWAGRAASLAKRVTRAGCVALLAALFASAAHAQTAAIVANTESLAVDEGASATYTVVLATQPSANVTVTVASDNTDVTVDTSTTSGAQSTLTFSNANWNTAQTVTVTAAGDAGSADETATLTHTASGGGYGSVTHGLFVAVQDDEQTGTDYDTDEDGLIEISSLAQLNAIRWDLNGDGAVSAADATNYTTAFPTAAAGMGCPDGSDAGDAPDACTGYELTQDLDFDTDDDGDVDTDDPNSYANWAPIGGDYSAVFDGNHHRIFNLTIDRAGPAALFSTISGTVRKLGLVHVNVRATGALNRAAALVDVLSGTALACWSTGSVVAVDHQAGGLVGLVSGRLAASFSAASVNAITTATGNDAGTAGGLAMEVGGSAAVVASYAVGTVSAGRHGASFVGKRNHGGTIRASYATGAASTQGFTALRAGSPNLRLDNYCDFHATGRRGCQDARQVTTSQLQGPTSATGIYANWDDLDVNGDTAANEDPWNFGASNQYPVLSYAGLDSAFQFAMQGQLPDFGSGTVQDRTVGAGADIQAFQVPAASRAIDYAATGLPPGLSLDADGTGACAAARTICGAPTWSGTFDVTLWALADDLGARRAALRFTITVTPAVAAQAVTLGTTTRAATLDSPTILVDEGASSTYTVVLASQPSANVTVTVASDNTDVTADTSATPGVQTTLTFSSTNWSTAQTVVVTVAEDAGSVDETATLTLTASGGGYGSATYALLVGVRDDERTGTDYDADEDGLIEISSLAQLNAIRWDALTSGTRSASDMANHALAFPGAAAGMGCPDGSDAGDVPDACRGYELAQDLDFDTNDSGAADSGDEFWNNGAGWVPLPEYRGVLRGNGHIIYNLYMNHALPESGLFDTMSGRVEWLGLVDVNITNTRASQITAGGLAAYSSAGTITGVFVTGVISGNPAATDGSQVRRNTVGGLVGLNFGFPSGTAIRSCWVDVRVSGKRAAGLVGNVADGTVRSQATVHHSLSRGTLAPGSNPLFHTQQGTGNVVATYFDSTTHGTTTDGGCSACARTMAELRTPTGYEGIYATWDDADLDGDGEADAPWDFGDQWHYPVLSFGGFDPAVQFALQPNEAPTFDDGDDGDDGDEATVLNKTFWKGFPIDEFRVPAASGGEGTMYTYEVSGLPPGLSFGAPNCAARTVCGTPSANTTGAVTVTLYAHDGDINRADSDRASLTFTITVVDASVSPTSLALNEAAGVANANVGTFTATLQERPLSAVSMFVASSDPSAATVDKAALSFTPQNWNTAQTVTVTAQADDDADDESLTVTFSATSIRLRATVTVTDDDRGTVLIDADPATAALDAGPLLLSEASDAANNALGYAVRLSAAPTGNVTVAVASDDPGAATASPASLTFTTQNWSTAQTVTATAVADAPDAVDESATIAHTATGGGYNGTTSRLRVAVSDDERAGTDYDVDEDGLIEIASLAQLDAVRWDLNGDGAAASGDGGVYARAFPNASTGMGCAAGTGGAPACRGYELARDLDFDTDGSGTVGAGDDFWNGGAGWAPIGTAAAAGAFSAVFQGNGRTISNLTINNATITRVGLFARVSGRVEGLGLPDANVSASASQVYVGALAGLLTGTVVASYSTGSVVADSTGGANGDAGGLVGRMRTGGSRVAASYSTAEVSADSAAGGLVGRKHRGLVLASYAAGPVRALTGAANVGGLIGWDLGGAVTASYAAGLVDGSAPAAGGLVGTDSANGAFTVSYWDTEASGRNASGGGSDRATSALQTPTTATGIYARWDRLDVDGDGSATEAPWDFGDASQYPVLSYRGMDPLAQRGDYDANDNGLIEIRTLAQLDAVRWDLDGDGAPSLGNAAAYRKAFPGHAEDMGCPTSADDPDHNDCTGYELSNDLDFDTDGDGDVDADDPNSYPNWTPIAGAFSATFDGNHHRIFNLTIDRAGAAALFSTISGTVRKLGLVHVNVRATGSLSKAAALADVLNGTALACLEHGQRRRRG